MRGRVEVKHERPCGRVVRIESALRKFERYLETRRRDWPEAEAGEYGKWAAEAMSRRLRDIADGLVPVELPGREAGG